MLVLCSIHQSWITSIMTGVNNSLAPAGLVVATCRLFSKSFHSSTVSFTSPDSSKSDQKVRWQNPWRSPSVEIYTSASTALGSSDTTNTPLKISVCTGLPSAPSLARWIISSRTVVSAEPYIEYMSSEVNSNPGTVSNFDSVINCLVVNECPVLLVYINIRSNVLVKIGTMAMFISLASSLVLVIHFRPDSKSTSTHNIVHPNRMFL